MKKTIIILILGFLTSSFVKIKSNINTDVEVKNIIERRYEGEIDKIYVSNSIPAEIIKSDKEYVVLEGSDHDLEDVKVRLEKGNLRITMESKKTSFNRPQIFYVRAKIYVKEFTNVEANSSAKIVFKDKFTQDKVSVSISSSGSIKGNLEANRFLINANSSGEFEGDIWAVNLDANVSSSGEVKASGKVREANIETSSSGDFEGEKLEIKTANLSASSSGEISVSVLEKVSAQASSGGDIEIYHHGSLMKKNSKQNSGGTVKFKTL